MKLFRRKKKVEGINFDKYKMKITIKSICMFEHLAGKSFYKFNDEDVVTLLYCIFVCSNNLDYRLSTFNYLLEDIRVSKWFGEKFMGLMDYIKQFPQKDVEESESKSDESPYISDLASMLIINYGVDAKWVMEDMELWQIDNLFKAAEEKTKSHYEEERLWSYLSILPHVDGKKLSKPEKLLPFPWEKENRKKKAQTELKNNEYAIKHTIGMNIDDILHGTK